MFTSFECLFSSRPLLRLALNRSGRIFLNSYVAMANKAVSSQFIDSLCPTPTTGWNCANLITILSPKNASRPARRKSQCFNGSAFYKYTYHKVSPSLLGIMSMHPRNTPLAITCVSFYLLYATSIVQNSSR